MTGNGGRQRCAGCVCALVGVEPTVTGAAQAKKVVEVMGKVGARGDFDAMVNYEVALSVTLDALVAVAVEHNRPDFLPACCAVKAVPLPLLPGVGTMAGSVALRAR